ncbi:MAG: cupredoxin domain-containing protein, partial [Acidimicrobiales bacterium]
AEARTVVLDVTHSRYLPSAVEVPAGTTVRFVVRNNDPIDHELIIGGAEVHARHAGGTEAAHGAVPGEVSAPAGQTAETTLRFRTKGSVLFACHLPGHYAYGMTGTIRVT